MIDFRYHIVSIVAVFLALALGLFLGSTTLQGSVLSSLDGQVKHVQRSNAQLRQTNSTLVQQVKHDEAALKAVTPIAISSALVDDSVAIVSEPGVSSSTESNLIKDLQTAEATVTAQVQLEPLLFDPSKSTFLQSLANQIKPAGLSIPSNSGTLAASTTIAAALAERPDKVGSSAATEQSILQSLQAGKVLSLSGDIADVRPARLVLVLTPDATATPKDELARDNADMLAITKLFASHSVGVVLAGPANPLGSGTDVLSLARSDGNLPTNLATVDSIGTAAGQIAAVLALVDVFNGGHGAYGLQQPTPLPAAPVSQ